MRSVTDELGPFPDAAGYDEARDRDRDDPLAAFRHRFVIDDPDLIYLDGNSLGRLPATTRDVVDRVIDSEWGNRLIRSWNEGWWDLQLEIGDRLAPLLGASPGEVMISDSTSVNLYKLAMAATSHRSSRAKVVTDDLNFPTDIYVLSGVAAANDRRLEVVETGGFIGAAPEVHRAIDDETALLSLSHTTFKSGFTYDVAAMTARAHDVGALVLWDLSHSAGVIPIDLNGAGVDLAVGCTYKYLNGGPGSPAFLYVRRDLQPLLENPIPGWWGHAEPFAFDLEYRPIQGIRRFHTGTIPVLSLAPIAAGISDLAEAGIVAVREKSVSLSEFLIGQWEHHLARLGFELASPRDPGSRGSHVSLSHEEAWPIARAMVELGRVIPDFRAPDNLRLGLPPLYSSHVEIHTAVQRMKRIVERGLHHGYAGSKPTVT
jgi:kynureninase